ncbi:DinB family protein [Aquimarina sp. 2201CG5-10]|uniref:DinB family protein n=1 Tax=Aquimarina callyspongiae TaxID=3098150 RepID=UPI002AB48F42|nr:DinB family protein [Aquimarina sp. 2201CG5-10]MDY8138927.1 DinB family protein [Aquimarina sp. 2201CG5-10]
MEKITKQLGGLLIETEKLVLEMDKESIEYKVSSNKWSKKEILGHLIDSAINNLQRFTEVQFMPKPYVIRKYAQSDLVVANKYQDKEISSLLQLWISLNQQILFVISNLDRDMLDLKIDVDHNNSKTLKWLIEDYVIHMKHHLNQIKN